MTFAFLVAYAVGGLVGVTGAYLITTAGRGSRWVSGPLAVALLLTLVLFVPAETAWENFAEGICVGGAIISAWRFVSPQSWERKR